MKRATQTLPQGYAQTREINLSKDKTMAWVVNVVGLLAICPSWWRLIELAWRVRPSGGPEKEFFNADFPFLLYNVCLVVLFPGIWVLHELVHAFFFWLYTRSRPGFSLSSICIYVAAPGWYLPASQYLIVGLSPLLIITALFFILAFVVPVEFVIPMEWVSVISMLAAINVMGSLSDLWVVFQLLLSGLDCWVNDKGDAVYFYEKGQTEPLPGK